MKIKPPETTAEYYEFEMLEIWGSDDPRDPTPPTYWMVNPATGARLEIGPSKNIFNQHQFLAHMATLFGGAPDRRKQPEWDIAATDIIANAEKVTPGHPEHPRNTAEVQETQEWVADFLHSATPAPSAEDAIQLYRPFEHEGLLHFRACDLGQWLLTARAYKPDKGELSTRLRNAGYSCERMDIGGHKRNVWHEG